MSDYHIKIDKYKMPICSGQQMLHLVSWKSSPGVDQGNDKLGYEIRIEEPRILFCKRCFLLFFSIFNELTCPSSGFFVNRRSFFPLTHEIFEVNLPWRVSKEVSTSIHIQNEAIFFSFLKKTSLRRKKMKTFLAIWKFLN